MVAYHFVLDSVLKKPVRLAVIRQTRDPLEPANLARARAKKNEKTHARPDPF
jgi:hypothetical protein